MTETLQIRFEFFGAEKFSVMQNGRAGVHAETERIKYK